MAGTNKNIEDFKIKKKTLIDLENVFIKLGHFV